MLHFSISRAMISKNQADDIIRIMDKANNESFNEKASSLVFVRALWM